MRLLIPFSRIYAGLTLKPTYIGMCAKGQMILEFSLMWIRVTCLLNFHMPLKIAQIRPSITPLKSYIGNPLDTFKGEELKRKKTIVHCFQSLYLSLHPFVPWSTLCSSQACLLLVTLLSRDGGLKWWRPKWGTQFLRFADMPTKVVTIVIFVLY